MQPDHKLALRAHGFFLLTLPQNLETFDMFTFHSDTQAPKNHTCGTAACSLGWTPTSLNLPNRAPAWYDLAEELFGIVEDTSVWYFLFDTDHPNDPHAAGRRCLFVADHPDNNNPTQDEADKHYNRNYKFA